MLQGKDSRNERRRHNQFAPIAGTGNRASERLGEHRLDGPHALRSTAAGAAAWRRPTKRASTPVGNMRPMARRSSTGGGLMREERDLLQASQIAEHLSTQFAEMDRREQRLNGQLALLDQERRSVRLWVSQFEEEAEDRDARLHQQEADCTERLQQCAKLEHELEQQRQELLRSQQRIGSRPRRAEC